MKESHKEFLQDIVNEYNIEEICKQIAVFYRVRANYSFNEQVERVLDNVAEQLESIKYE